MCKMQFLCWWTFLSGKNINRDENLNNNIPIYKPWNGMIKMAFLIKKQEIFVFKII